MIELIGAKKGADAVVSVADGKELSTTEKEIAQQYPSLFSGFFARLCVAVTLGVILLVVGELVSYRQHLPNAQDMMEPVINRNLSHLNASEREYWREYDTSHTFTYQPYVLWRHKPFHGSMINVSEDGIRQTLHTQCEQGNFTIWMFGDSTLWGVGSTDDETIPSFLAADYEREGRKVCVINYGEGGWSNTQEVIELLEQLKHAPRRPDVVIFYDGGTEAFTALQSHQADLPSNYSTFRNYLETWSAEQRPGFSYLQKTNTHRLLEKLAGNLPLRVEANGRSTMSDDEAQSLAGSILQNYEQNMDVVGLLAQKYGFRAIFTWYPVLVAGHKRLTPYEQAAEKEQERRFPGITRMYRAAYARCEQTHRENLYYLGDVFNNEPAWLFRGIAHLKPKGNQIVADRLFQIVEQPSHPSNGKNVDAPKPHDGQHARTKPV